MNQITSSYLSPILFPHFASWICEAEQPRPYEQDSSFQEQVGLEFEKRLVFGHPFRR
jgi:hypothetical protein